MNLFNFPEFLNLRKKLRKNPTYSEKILWNQLKNSSFMNLKFRRQHGIGNYIVDFYCHSKNLVIEIDGEVHDLEGAKDNDKIRTEFLNSNGLKVLRFSNIEVQNKLEKVLEGIKKVVG